MEEQPAGQPGGAGESEGAGHFCSNPKHANAIYNDVARYLPDGEVMRVRVNLVIIQRADGSGNFRDIPEHRDFLDEWFQECNDIFGATWWSPLPGCQPPSSDARVEFVPNWVFLADPSQNEYYWNYLNHQGNSYRGCPNTTGWWLEGLDNIINNDPSIPRGINVYFTMDADIYHQLVTLQTINDPFAAGAEYTWCSEHPNIEDLEAPSRIHVANFFLKYFWFQNHESVVGQPFSTSRQNLIEEDGVFMAHELAHSVIGEYTHYFACADHILAPASAQSFNNRAMRIDDVQFIHRGFVYNNLRQFIDCDTRYNASMYSPDREWIIANDEEWTRDMRLYHNLRIPAGVTLTIRCKLLLPEDGVVIVERGGRLIVDGGKIWRANTCSAEQHWAGIAVKGNPNALQPNPNDPLTANDGGVVLLQGDGEIEGAVIGVATQSHPHWDVPADRGGLIQGDVFTFRDNVRGVQFMRYDLPNFSKFTDVTFINENGNAKWGVTMWRTHNIGFEGSVFQNLTRNGINSWDASYNVYKRNRFLNCAFNGITAGGSMPLGGFIQVGNESNFGSDQNRFINNTVGFRGTSNVLTRIHGNYMDNFDFDVAVTGESDNDIFVNSFMADAAGVQLESTGILGSVTDCNVYNGNIVGINVVGNNQSMSFWREQFGTQFHDMFIEGQVTNPGEIMEFQGNQFDARWNFFTGAHNEQIKTSTVTLWNNTEHFNYFFPGNSSFTNVRPRCADNDPNCSPPSNFSNINADFGNQYCGIIPLHEMCMDRPCLDSVRYAIAILEGQSAQLSDSLKQQLELLVVKRERTVTQWLADYMLSSDWNDAEELVTSDPNPLNRRRHVAVALWQDDFSKADSLLNVYPQQTTEDQQFVAVQQINRSFLSDTAFELTTTQEAILYDVATSGTTQAGYAQTLLSLLADVQIMPRLPILDDEAEPRSSQAQDSDLAIGLSVNPNPAQDLVSIAYQSKGDSEMLLSITDAVTGREVIHRDLYAPFNEVFDSSQWPAGMYIVLLRNGNSGQVVSTRKLIVTK